MTSSRRMLRVLSVLAVFAMAAVFCGGVSAAEIKLVDVPSSNAWAYEQSVLEIPINMSGFGADIGTLQVVVNISGDLAALGVTSSKIDFLVNTSLRNLYAIPAFESKVEGSGNCYKAILTASGISSDMHFAADSNAYMRLANLSISVPTDLIDNKNLKINATVLSARSADMVNHAVGTTTGDVTITIRPYPEEISIWNSTKSTNLSNVHASTPYYLRNQTKYPGDMVVYLGPKSGSSSYTSLYDITNFGDTASWTQTWDNVTFGTASDEQTSVTGKKVGVVATTLTAAIKQKNPNVPLNTSRTNDKYETGYSGAATMQLIVYDYYVRGLEPNVYEGIIDDAVLCYEGNDTVVSTLYSVAWKVQDGFGTKKPSITTQGNFSAIGADASTDGKLNATIGNGDIFVYPVNVSTKLDLNVETVATPAVTGVFNYTYTVSDLNIHLLPNMTIVRGKYNYTTTALDNTTRHKITAFNGGESKLTPAYWKTDSVGQFRFNKSVNTAGLNTVKYTAYKLGDANLDDTVNIVDSSIIGVYILKGGDIASTSLAKFEDTNKVWANVVAGDPTNGIDVADLVAVNKYLVGVDTPRWES